MLWLLLQAPEIGRPYRSGKGSVYAVTLYRTKCI